MLPRSVQKLILYDYIRWVRVCFRGVYDRAWSCVTEMNKIVVWEKEVIVYYRNKHNRRNPLCLHTTIVPLLKYDLIKKIRWSDMWSYKITYKNYMQDRISDHDVTFAKTELNPHKYMVVNVLMFLYSTAWIKPGLGAMETAYFTYYHSLI